VLLIVDGVGLDNNAAGEVVDEVDWLVEVGEVVLVFTLGKMLLTLDD